MLWPIFAVVAMFVCVTSDPLLPSIASKQHKVAFVYPSGAQSERDLFVCPENSGCNVIHKRFWLPPIIERLCRCPQRRECSWTWTDVPDSYTMLLDNRSQIKFCSNLEELPKCTLKKPSIRITIRSPNKEGDSTLIPKNRNSQKIDRKTEQRNVTAFCNCQEPHYWKLKPNSTKYDEDLDLMQQTYFCSKLRKCSRSEFCGNVRTDTYSTFYRCSCPNGHLCITKDKSAYRADELLFSGQAYKAFCIAIKKSSRSKN